MLLRSASHPILNSWSPHTKETSPEPEMSPQIQRTRSGNHLLSLSMSLSPSNSFSMSPSDEHMSRESSERRRSPQTPIARGLSSVSVEEEREAEDPDFESEPSSALSPILLSTGLEGLITAVNECCVSGEKKSKGCSTLVFGSGCGSGGGKVCGGGGGGDGGGSDGAGGFGPSDSDNGNESVDAYYQKMIKGDPGNALLLGNYSKFLKEVRCNLEKAERYCGLAILANPTDASVLALYADLIWQTHGDAPRAESYFERAIQAAPDDCYVMGSYARFLWDAETVEEEKEEENEFDKEYCCSSNSSPPFFHGTSFPSPIAATS